MTYSERLREALAAYGPLCVGLDPMPTVLHGWGLRDDVTGLAQFADIAVEAFAGVVAVVKPQVAFYEEHGYRGVAVLESLIGRFRDAGTLVIADAKRGDIGSTMAGYARAWLGKDSGLAADAVTLSPYLGFESLRPALDLAQERGRGVYVLARTSNPEGGDVQLAHPAADTAPSVAQRIVDLAAAENRDAGTDYVGLVIGATRAHGLHLNGFGGSILAPGLGAQGGTPAELPDIFPAAVQALLAPSSSRSVLALGPDAEALRAGARSVAAQIRRVLLPTGGSPA